MGHKLEKKYGLLTAMCMVIGIVIGSGVFFKAETILTATAVSYTHLALVKIAFARP